MLAHVRVGYKFFSSRAKFSRGRSVNIIKESVFLVFAFVQVDITW